jgi:hypothetical protein
MKNIILISVVLLITYTSCKKDSDKHDFQLIDTVTMKYGEKYNCVSENFSLKFDSVVSDFRCPMDANCVSAGNAVIRFSYQNKIKTVSFILNSNLPLHTDTVIDNYKIKFVRLAPYPFGSLVIKQHDYEVSVVLSKQ